MPESPHQSSSNITGARQTMQTWARVIDSLADAPEDFQGPLEVLVQGREDFPYTVYAPVLEGPGSTHQDRVLCHSENTLFVLQKNDAVMTTTSLRYTDISLLEVGNILLYSWFSIRGKSIQGEETALTIEFNESTLRHFEPFLKQMRPACVEGADRAVEQAKFGFLSRENFKLMNFACQNLVPGERVLQIVYQSIRRKKLMTVLGRSIYRTLSLAHLMLLADRELILIGEAEHVEERNRGKYGGVQAYIPLRAIVSMEVEPTPAGMVKLNLKLLYDVCVERIVDEALRADLEKLVDKFNEVLDGKHP